MNFLFSSGDDCLLDLFLGLVTKLKAFVIISLLHLPERETVGVLVDLDQSFRRLI